jgi:hypothetical protein
VPNRPPSPLSVPGQAGVVHRSVPLGTSLGQIDLPKQLGGGRSHLNSHPLGVERHLGIEATDSAAYGLPC